ncbi:MAG: ABC transporter permease [Lentisphaeria bacterium]|nr:ABC transporter permease [Lentisphaeria bacterium]NQZ71355.1 ABC transporter permease [Lentisphaeria bacterium]
MKELLLRSIRFRNRGQFSLFFCSLICTTVITSSLFIGDSVKQSLEQSRQNRIAKISYTISMGDRFCSRELALNVSVKLSCKTASLINLRTDIKTADETLQAFNVNCYGIGDDFYELNDITLTAPKANEIFINEELANQLNASAGGEYILKIEKPSYLPRDAKISSQEKQSIAIRVKVAKILNPSELANFNLQNSQLNEAAIFMSRQLLAEKIEREHSVNLILLDTDKTPEDINTAIKDVWQLKDMALVLRKDKDLLELRSKRVFIDTKITKELLTRFPDATPILTYLINSIETDKQSTPYSMVTAIASPLTKELKPGQTIITEWLEKDLSVKKGETIDFNFFVVDNNELVNQKASFRIADIIPTDSNAIDSGMMPDFPGFETENCRDWDSGATVELDKIRDKDEDYWDEYKGRPKAIIAIAAGQKIWKNRFGNLSALRFQNFELREKEIVDLFEPRDVNFQISNLAAISKSAVNQSMDFSALFLSFSFLIIVAAMILTLVLYLLILNKRRNETGLLQSLGYSRKQIFILYNLEAALFSIPGILLGLVVGSFYCKMLLGMLAKRWQDVIGDWQISFIVTQKAIAISVIMSLLLILFCTSIILYKQLKVSSINLLRKNQQLSNRTYRRSLIVSIVLFLSALGANLMPSQFGPDYALKGFLILIFLLSLINLAFRIPLKSESKSHLLIAIKNLSRNPLRNLALSSALAIGCFLIASLQLFKLDANDKAGVKASGTGSFYYLAESTHPLIDQLDKTQLNKTIDLALQSPVQSMRVHQGDDSSCLNLNKAQSPLIYALNPKDFQKQFKFKMPGDGSWKLLNESLGDGVIPVMTDFNTLLYSLQLMPGATLDYSNAGKTWKLKFIATLDNSIFQNAIIMSEANFKKVFPDESGYNLFLFEDQLSESQVDQLKDEYSDFGFTVHSTIKRLNQYNKVQNTYISIFQILGSLGLIIATLGFGTLILHSINERQSELALFQSIGFSRNEIVRLLIYEYSILFLMAVASGTIATAFAMIPFITKVSAELSWSSSIQIIAGITVCGIISTCIAAKLSLKTDLISALRSE